MGQKRTLSGWLTNRYLLIIRNEENFAEKKTIIFNIARVILVLGLGFLITLAISIYIVTSVLEEWLDPGYAQSLANRQIIELTMSIDSLERKVYAQNQFIDNVRLILSGDDNTYAVFDQSDVALATTDISLADNIAPIDSQFRAEFEQSDLGLLSYRSSDDDELNDIYLFKPVNGIVTQPFQPATDHFGIDIVAKENEGILAVADGVVVFSSWTLDGGYVIGIQHRGNLISVYKHNSELLKNVGSFVTSGEIIAIIGNTGELTSGPHLHFELWHKGNPVNPEDYLSY